MRARDPESGNGRDSGRNPFRVIAEGESRKSKIVPSAPTHCGLRLGCLSKNKPFVTNWTPDDFAGLLDLVGDLSAGVARLIRLSCQYKENTK